MATSEHKFWFTNPLYNGLKFIALIVLPASGAAYFSLSEVWGLPYGPQIVGTITIIDTFLGVVLGLSSKSYYSHGANFDGEAVVIGEGEDRRLKLSIDEDLIDKPGKHSVEFKLNRPTDPGQPS